MAVISAELSPLVRAPREVFVALEKLRGMLCSQANTALELARRGLAVKLKQAKRRARELGYRQGAIKAQAEICNRLIGDQERYQKLVNQAKSECLELVLGISREVIGGEVTQNIDSLISRISRALEQLLDRQSIVLKLSPQDFATLPTKNLLGLARIEPLDTLTPGNALLITVSGTVELAWQEHWQLLRNRLRSKLLFEESNAFTAITA